MDAKHFDRVAKAVGQGTARRRLLTGLLGAILAGSLGYADAPAKGKRQHHRRHRLTGQKKGDNAQGTGKPAGTPCKNDTPCQPGHRCCGVTQRQPGTCQRCCDDTHCTPPQTCGSGQCVPTGFPYHCVCNDTTSVDSCDPRDCGGVNLPVVCAELCAGKGGFTIGTSCNVVRCILSNLASGASPA
jgi:hypothetical protein